jgi:flagellar capping protein FliD
MLNTSSTPGTNINMLSDMGISVDKTGQMQVDDKKLDAALADNYVDVVKVFSANTDDQSTNSTDSAGIAGDLAKLIANATASNSYRNLYQ